MSFHLLPESRRSFLQTTIAGGVALFVTRPASVLDTETDVNKWAFLSDTHIDADETTKARGAVMFDNLNRIIDEVLAEDPLPAGVIINGDCAYLKGLDADYATLSKALQRFTDVGLPVHMTMGNHDDRGPFYAAFARHRPANPLVEGKHVSVLESPRANLLLLDSLLEVNQTPGELGQSQLDWLTEALDARADKPAIVIGHHNPQFVPEGSTVRVSGLKDTSELIEALDSRQHAQAYVFGHTHVWKTDRTSDGLNLVNLPPCAYVFDGKRPNGWVRVTFQDDQFTLELRALDQEHEQHGETLELAWRSAGIC